MNRNNIVDQLEKGIKKEHIRIDEPMSKHTSFKIGGPADIFIQPASIEELLVALEVSRASNCPYFIIGNGSNLLVRDKGFRGVIIQIYKHWNTVKVTGEKVYAQAGILLTKLAKIMIQHSLQGFEFASGIPGTLGGAVFMNAGAYGGEMKQVVESVEVIDDKGRLTMLSNQALDFGYRSSSIQNKDMIVVSATLDLKKGRTSDIIERIEELKKKRKEKQPLEWPSAGSAFKRPEGYYAGKLIMDSDLKGFQIGGACVSEKHCGFIINKKQACAKDVIKLIEHIQLTVRERFGVNLSTEIRIIGEA